MPCAAQRLAQLIVVDVVLLLDLLDRRVDLLAGDAQLQLGRLLQDQLVVDQALQHLAAQRRRARRALVGVGDAVLTSASSGAAFSSTSLARMMFVADDRRDLLDDARLRRAAPAPTSAARRQRRERASATRASRFTALPCGTGRGAGMPGGGCIGAACRARMPGRRRSGIPGGASLPGMPGAAVAAAVLDRRPWPGSRR